MLYQFTGGQDGGIPVAALTVDGGGRLYGTAAYGGNTGGSCSAGGCGTVFRLVHNNSGWSFTTLHSFTGWALGEGGDGANPTAKLVFGPDGALYGTTLVGGGPNCQFQSGNPGCGTVFRITPPTTVIGNWNETVLARFEGDLDGGYPDGELVFDPEGNIYGSASGWGEFGNGAIYMLPPHGMLLALYEFTGGADGANPTGVVFDGFGNLYGTAFYGGTFNSDTCLMGCGTVFELIPNIGFWDLNLLYSFQSGSDGANPVGAIFDSGNLYGPAKNGGQGSFGGTVYELTAPSWGFNLIYTFIMQTGVYGYGPSDKLTMDAAGNLYGTTTGDGAYSYGNVFELTPSGGGWIYTDLYDFTGGADGGNPTGGVVLDSKGNLFGTTGGGGDFSGKCLYSSGCGVIFEITR